MKKIFFYCLYFNGVMLFVMKGKIRCVIKCGFLLSIYLNVKK